AAALAGHAKDICVVNGIWMSVGGLSSHEACRVYMSSGESKSTRSAATILPFEVAANMTRGPFQVVVNNTRETWNARRSNIVPQVLNPAVGAAEAVQVEQPAVHGLLNGIAANGNSTIRDTLNAYINAAGFRQQYETYMAGFRQEGEVEFEHAAASAFLSGASYQAFYNLGGDYHPPGPGLDNHSGYVNVHAGRALWFMEKISAIFDLFK